MSKRRNKAFSKENPDCAPLNDGRLIGSGPWLSPPGDAPGTRYAPSEGGNFLGKEKSK